MSEPRSRRISQEQWKVADNKIVTIRSTSLASKPIILETRSEVCFPGVFRDVGRWSVPRWEDDVEDVSAKGLRSRQVGAWVSVLATIIASTIMRVVAMASLLPRIAAGTPVSVEAVARVTVEAETFMHRDCDPGLLPCGAWRTDASLLGRSEGVRWLASSSHH